MEDIKFKLEVECVVTQQSIEDLMVTALEGGINYWCGECNIKSIGDCTKDTILASDVIGYNGVLELVDGDDDDSNPDRWLLTRTKFISGLQQEMISSGYNSVEDLMDNYDATTADNIIQYALFNKLVFS